MTNDWRKGFWSELLEGRYNDGKKDAEKWFFNPPWPDDEDPQNQDENEAYILGYRENRRL